MTLKNEHKVGKIRVSKQRLPGMDFLTFNVSCSFKIAAVFLAMLTFILFLNGFGNEPDDEFQTAMSSQSNLKKKHKPDNIVLPNRQPSDSNIRVPDSSDYSSYSKDSVSLDSIDDENYNMDDMNGDEDKEYYDDDGVMIPQQNIGDVEMDLLEEMEALLDEAENEVDSEIMIAVELEEIELLEILKKHGVNATEDDVQDIFIEAYIQAREKLIKNLQDEVDYIANEDIEVMEEDNEAGFEIEDNIEEDAANDIKDLIDVTEKMVEEVVSDIVKKLVKEKYGIDIELDNEDSIDINYSSESVDTGINDDEYGDDVGGSSVDIGDDYDNARSGEDDQY